MHQRIHECMKNKGGAGRRRRYNTKNVLLLSTGRCQQRPKYCYQGEKQKQEQRREQVEGAQKN